jgi:nucleoside-triphosphatase THEP1
MEGHTQMEAISTVLKGHNLLVTGQAGTGKSFFLKRVVGDLKKQGKKVAILSPSGIAATQFAEYNATTVHRQVPLF